MVTASARPAAPTPTDVLRGAVRRVQSRLGAGPRRDPRTPQVHRPADPRAVRSGSRSGRSAQPRRRARIRRAGAAHGPLGLSDGGPVGRVRRPQRARRRLQALGYVAGGSAIRATLHRRRTIPSVSSASIASCRTSRRSTWPATAAARSPSRRRCGPLPAMPMAWLRSRTWSAKPGDLASGVRRFAARASARSVECPGRVAARRLSDAGAARRRRRDVLTPLAAGADADVEVLRALAIAEARRGQPDAGIAPLGVRGRSHRTRRTPGRRRHHRSHGRTGVTRPPALEQAIAADPGLADAQSALAALLARRRPHRRRRCALAGRRTADASQYGRIFALGVAQARAGRPAQARAAFEFFVASAPPAALGAELAQARAGSSHSR